ncbi:MAG: zinc-ribbon domain-containing protein [Candidatus Kapaibacteriota bacterium]|jgi:uncharacterized membrane protein YvbJ
MALIKCNECGKQVSNNAMQCPNCGNQIQQQIVQNFEKQNSGGCLKVIGWIALIGFVILYILSKKG